MLNDSIVKETVKFFKEKNIKFSISSNGSTIDLTEFGYCIRDEESFCQVMTYLYEDDNVEISHSIQKIMILLNSNIWTKRFFEKNKALNS